MIEVLRLGRLRVGLVVDGDVEEDVLGVLAEHPRQSALDDVRQFVGERRIVSNHSGIRRRQQQRVTVGVLQSLADQRGAPGGGAQHESAGHLVGGSPEAVAGALEAEHRIEDVDRDHRLVMGGVRGAHCGERCARTGLVDSLMQDLAGLGFLVRQHELGVDGGVELAVAVVDLQRREPRVHAEGARLIGDDRHDAGSDVLVAQEFLEHPHRGHGGGHLLLSGAGLERLVDIPRWQSERLGLGAPRRQEAAQRGAPVEQVADLRRLLAGVVVRRQVRVVLQLGVGERDPHRIAEVLEVLQRKLFHLMRRVAALEV